jgi:hypothetical protein
MRRSPIGIAADAVFDDPYGIRFMTMPFIVMNKSTSPKALYARQ